ncbi:hypothetical protein [uncultured Algoriphagus sp.]|uniref:hypothetical protein n=1 Tax=uncultured Algoriphagus sp. TaxID=417365 RepID=UPI0030EC2DC4|tara:strand:- start:23497 stop:24009 length:513 start_codon:yes stop_codon:yes gene_type:complete
MRNFPRLLLLSLFGAFLLTSCQEDEKPIDNSDQIVGYWEKSINSGENMILTQYFTFFDNGTYNSSSVYFNAETDEPLGYAGRSSGEFTLLDDQLSIMHNLIYGVPQDSDEIYVPNNQLVLTNNEFTEEMKLQEVKVEFSEDKMIWIYPPCGPLENCIGSQEFERYTPIQF